MTHPAHGPYVTSSTGPPKRLASQVVHELQVAARMIERGLSDRDRLILRGWSYGMTARQLADAAGLRSHVAVLKIVRRYDEPAVARLSVVST